MGKDIMRIDDSKRVRELKKLRKRQKLAEVPLPLEIQQDKSLLKYWHNRYRLFKKFDRGIKLDKESWYSVTPEVISAMIAKRCKCDMIIDGFCGAGGNAIQFALNSICVIAIDIDPLKIQLARNNAEVYGVADRIEFIVGDYYALAPTLKADAVFLSPPWGGPSYSTRHTYSIDYIMPHLGGGRRLFEITRQITEHIAFFLPRNVDVQESITLAGESNYVEIETYFFEERLNSKTFYYGNLVKSKTMV